MKEEEEDKKEKLELKLQGIDDDTMCSPFVQTALHQSIVRHEAANVELLLLEGADKNERSENGYTPLHVACEEKARTPRQERLYIKIIECLLSKEYEGTSPTDINALDKNNNTPLHMATYRKNSERAVLLMSKGADLSIKNKKGKTPLEAAMEIRNGEFIGILLCKAVSLNYYNVVETLIKQNIDVSSKAKYSMTPLHFAVENGHIAIVELLLKHKADIRVKNVYNETPFDLARNTNNKSILDIFNSFEAANSIQREGKTTCLSFAEKEALKKSMSSNQQMKG